MNEWTLNKQTWINKLEQTNVNKQTIDHYGSPFRVALSIGDDNGYHS